MVSHYEAFVHALAAFQWLHSRSPARARGCLHGFQTRSASGKPPPATRPENAAPILYEIYARRTSRSGRCRSAWRAMCLDQGRSVGGSARADAYPAAAQPRHSRRKCLVLCSFGRTPLPVMHSACNDLHFITRQPEFGSLRSERRDPQCFLPRLRCLLWVKDGPILSQASASLSRPVSSPL
jgi:hypothetical protein